MIVVRTLWGLPLSVRGFTVPSPDGVYNVYINGDLSEEARERAVKHELGHIRRGDFSKNFADLVIK